MRLYAHLFLSEGCEAPGCRARRCSLYPRPGGLVRACSPLHAGDADRSLAEEEARQIESENHLVDGEPLPELDEGSGGLIF